MDAKMRSAEGTPRWLLEAKAVFGMGGVETLQRSSRLMPPPVT